MTINSGFFSGVNTTDFMAVVTNQARIMETGIRELRYDLTADPLRCAADVGSDAVVLSGLKDKCTASLSHLKRLYDETRFLRDHLEKV